MCPTCLCPRRSRVLWSFVYPAYPRMQQTFAGPLPCIRRPVRHGRNANGLHGPQSQGASTLTGVQGRQESQPVAAAGLVLTIHSAVASDLTHLAFPCEPAGHLPVSRSESGVSLGLCSAVLGCRPWAGLRPSPCAHSEARVGGPADSRGPVLLTPGATECENPN